jgi:hypothetical protein
MSEFLEQLGIEKIDPMGKDEEAPIFIGDDSNPEDAPVAVYQENEVSEEVNTAIVEMSEVEKRLQKAVLYQQWASGNLYDQKTPSTIEVEAEFREFALSQLNKLIGIKQQEPEVKSSFDEQEIVALKTLAQMVINNPSLLGGKKQVKEPARVQQTAVKQAVTKPRSEPVKPAAKPVGRPKLIKQEVPQEIVVKPAPIAQPAQIRQSPQPQQTRPVSNQPAKRGPQFYKDGEQVEEGGKKYEIKWSLTRAGAYGPAEEIRLNNMPQKTCLLLKDGMTVYKTEGDQIFKVIKMDKTPKLRPEEAVPFPRNMTIATIAAAEAGANAANNRFVNETRR